METKSVSLVLHYLGSPGHCVPLNWNCLSTKLALASGSQIWNVSGNTAALESLPHTNTSLDLEKTFPDIQELFHCFLQCPQRICKAFLDLSMPTEPSHTKCWLVRRNLHSLETKIWTLVHRLFDFLKFWRWRKGLRIWLSLSESVHGVLFRSVVIAMSST